jgi:hypothetical protein
MRKTTPAQASLLALALFLVASTVLAGKKDKELSLRIEGEDGTRFSMSISADFVASILEGLAGSDMDCDATTDEETREMLVYLDRHGEGSKYRFRDEEGKLVKARRERGQLELDIERSEEKDAHVSLPWAVAECMLGRRAALSADAHLEFAVEDDGGIRISIE